MTRNQQLFQAAYAPAHMASDALSEMAAIEAPFELAQVRAVRRLLNESSASLLALESLLAGNPEPRRGD